MSWVGAECLIPLKAKAWLDLSERRELGENVDSKAVRKHRNDVVQLSQLLAPAKRVTLVPKIYEHLSASLDWMMMPPSTPNPLGYQHHERDNQPNHSSL